MCLPQKSHRAQVLSESRFPSELKKDSLFIGNMTNVMQVDHAQLKLLNIKHVFYLSPQPFEDVDKTFKTTWIEVQEQNKPIIDFDAISL